MGGGVGPGVGFGVGSLVGFGVGSLVGYCVGGVDGRGVRRTVGLAVVGGPRVGAAVGSRVILVGFAETVGGTNSIVGTIEGDIDGAAVGIHAGGNVTGGTVGAAFRPKAASSCLSLS